MHTHVHDLVLCMYDIVQLYLYTCTCVTCNNNNLFILYTCTQEKLNLLRNPKIVSSEPITNTKSKDTMCITISLTCVWDITLIRE